jgi:hypothetical protein
MDTSGHIIVHIQNIENSHYLRIIQTNDISAYVNELKIVYGIDVLDNAHMIHYNCAQLYDRLIHDAKFKKFKGVNLSTSDACGDNIYKVDVVDDAIDVYAWFNEIYLPWIRVKLESYITDLDEYSFYEDVDLSSFPWETFTLNDHVTVQCTADGLIYQFVNCESSSDSMYVLTRMQAFALILRMLERNLFYFYDSIPSDPNTDLEISPCALGRGVCINKSSLTKNEAAWLCYQIGISATKWLSIMNCEGYKKYVGKNSWKDDFVPCEYNMFDGYYSFLTDQHDDIHMDDFFDVSEDIKQLTFFCKKCTFDVTSSDTKN